jgi:hypothetical protein
MGLLHGFDARKNKTIPCTMLAAASLRKVMKINASELGNTRIMKKIADVLV